MKDFSLDFIIKVFVSGDIMGYTLTLATSQDCLEVK